MGMMEPAVNARIQDMRIVTKVSLSEEEADEAVAAVVEALAKEGAVLRD